MCIGTPMQVLSSTQHIATCIDGETQHPVDISLVGPQKPGTWLLVFLGAAREVLPEAEALKMRDALTAVAQVMAGGSDIDHLFADLINREPQLPPHLQPQTNNDNQETPQ